MFRFSMIAIFVGFATSLIAADNAAPEEEQSEKPSSSKLAVVDISHLFKHHAGLKKSLENLKAEAMLVQAEFESETKAVQKKAEGLKDLTAGTTEYNKLESQLVKSRASIQTDIELKRKEFTQREARLYLDVYKQIQRDVAILAKRQHFTVVMNGTMDEISSDKPDDVARGISSRMVWFDDSVNLTPQLEKKYASP